MVTVKVTHKYTECWVRSRESCSYHLSLKDTALRLSLKGLNFQYVEVWRMVLLLLLRFILLLFLEKSTWEEGAGAAGALPRGLRNWKCSRTSCSWETFCLVVWYARDWLLAFSPRPLDLGKATYCVSVYIHVLFWLLRRFGFMCIVSVEAAGTAQPGTSAWTLANFRHSNTHALNLEIKSITWAKCNKVFSQFLIKYRGAKALALMVIIRVFWLLPDTNTKQF